MRLSSRRFPAVAHALIGALLLTGSGSTPADERDADAWFADGARAAAERIGGNPGRARNVVLFVGDGMGVSTVTAARIFAGQQAGGAGEDHLLAFERLPFTALARTYSTTHQVADSAPTMTAIVTGSKAPAAVISVGPGTIGGDCASSQGRELLTLLQLAELAGMATGIVTTTRITHATPAATYAHVAQRRWESDAEMPRRAREVGCRDIARQLIEFPFGDGPDVIMGGGRSRFLPNTVADPEYPELSGMRRDGRDLIAEWQAGGTGRAFAWNRAQFDAIDGRRDRQVLALFEPEHMRFEVDRGDDPGGEPSLPEMVDTALDLLQRQRIGWLLIVEGGRIDHGHHFGQAWRALDETRVMAEAVQRVIERTDPRDTLLIVTADHSHTLTIGGYPRRGNAITGLVRGSDGRPARDAAGLPYTTLAYANGPGWRAVRPHLDEATVTHPDYRQEAAVPLADETHGGEDVPVYASGPGASAVRGVIEQNTIYHLIVQNTPRLRQTQCRRAGGCRGADAVTRRPPRGQVVHVPSTSQGEP